MQNEHRNLIGPLTAGTIGRVSPSVAATHTGAASTLPSVTVTTATWTTLTPALGVSEVDR